MTDENIHQNSIYLLLKIGLDIWVCRKYKDWCNNAFSMQRCLGFCCICRTNVLERHMMHLRLVRCFIMTTCKKGMKNHILLNLKNKKFHLVPNNDVCYNTCRSILLT